ncbi:MAG: HD domain-containing protein [Succinivibrio sp.]
MPNHSDGQSAQSRLEQIFAFILKCDQEKDVFRQTYLTSNPIRQENDAEHAWHMCLMALVLQECANAPCDMLKVLSMLIVHDLIEVYAGDTFCYDEKAVAGQQEREAAAADRLYSMLPPDLGSRLRALWEEFERCESPEARFAKCMDNVQPCMLNAATGGRAWREHRVKLSQILKRNARTAEGSRDLWEYMKRHFIAPNLQKGNIEDDSGGAFLRENGIAAKPEDGGDGGSVGN